MKKLNQAISMILALGGLLGWHVWLVLSGQGTIDSLTASLQQRFVSNCVDFYENLLDDLLDDFSVITLSMDNQLTLCSNPYHLGWLRNFQETFDVHGRVWWLMWMMPSLKRKRGLGYRLPKRESAVEMSLGRIIV